MKNITLICALAWTVCLAGCDGSLKNEATKAVQDQLTDPQSAQFRGVTTYRGDTVCGEVNSKNKFGGYVGFQAFVYAKGSRTAEVTFAPPPDVTQSLCNRLSVAEQVEESTKQAEETAKLEASSAQPKCDEARATQAKYTKLLEDPATDTTENRKTRNDAAEVADYLCARAKVLVKDVKTGG